MKLFRPVYKIFQPIYAPIVNWYIQYSRIRDMQNKYRTETTNLMKNNQPVRIVVGAGYTEYAGWLMTDYPYLDITNRKHWASIFEPGMIDCIVSEHVIEHLTYDDFGEFLSIISKYLSPSGNIRIAIPDGYHPDQTYIKNVRPGGLGQGADDHKVLYTYHKMAELLEKYGFTYKFLEYFDEHGEFHKVNWTDEKGYILRSQENDHRNTVDNPTVYTSLIVDFWNDN